MSSAFPTYIAISVPSVPFLPSLTSCSLAGQELSTDCIMTASGKVVACDTEKCEQLQVRGAVVENN